MHISVAFCREARCNSRRYNSQDSVRKVSLQPHMRNAGQPTGKSCCIAKDEGGKADIDRLSQGRLRRWARFCEACTAARIHIHISKLAPYGPLCRWIRYAECVVWRITLRHCVTACWISNGTLTTAVRAATLDVELAAAPLRCLSREVQFAPDINSGNGLLVNETKPAYRHVSMLE